jgi:hypothetical protein
LEGSHFRSPYYASSCFDRMHTLLPQSASYLTTPNQHQADRAIRRLRLTLPLGPRRRQYYGVAQT